MRLIIFLAFCFFSFASYSKDTLVFFGGGGELEGEKTHFDKVMLNVASFLKNNSHYESYVAFNGNHSETDKILQTEFKNNQNLKKKFGIKEFESIIQDIKRKIESNPPLIKPGEKLIIFIATHGQRLDDDQKFHNIETSDFKDSVIGKTSVSVNIDSLKELSELANKKGISLGIIDNTCFSGSSLKLANKNTCVITSSLSDQVGYNDFSINFSGGLKKGKNLEDLFLETRSQSIGLPFPLISTQVGDKVFEDLKGLLPYLSFRGSDPKNGEFGNFDREIGLIEPLNEF